jgi:hypothetical protein
MKPSFRFALRAGLPLLLSGSTIHAATTSFNTGSLGAPANGTNSDLVALMQPGAISAGGDQSVGYSGGSNTTIPFQSSLNPAANVPFTIEFWSMPSAADGDDAAVSNRFATGNRSGWTFFQRDAATGWNFRMYSGAGSASGWDLTGGTAVLNAWNHVVATWNGSAAALYVNGVLADDTNAGGLSGVYSVNSAGNAPVFSIGANFDGGSPSTALMDEVAFYGSALSPAQILSHFNAASSPTAGAYHALVTGDGAQLLLSNNVPEPSSGLLLGLSTMALLWKRGRRV